MACSLGACLAMLFMSPSCGRRRGNWVRVSLLFQRNSHEPLVSPAEIDRGRVKTLVVARRDDNSCGPGFCKGARSNRFSVARTASSWPHRLYQGHDADYLHCAFQVVG